MQCPSYLYLVTLVNNTLFNTKLGIWISFILLQQNIITLLLALLYFMSCSLPYVEHTDNNKDKPIAEGGSLKGLQYMV